MLPCFEQVKVLSFSRWIKIELYKKKYKVVLTFYAVIAFDWLLELGPKVPFRNLEPDNTGHDHHLSK